MDECSIVTIKRGKLVKKKKKRRHNDDSVNKHLEQEVRYKYLGVDESDAKSKDKIRKKNYLSVRLILHTEL